MSEKRDAILLTVRSVLHLGVFIAVTAWGLFAFALPLPGIPIGLAALLAALALWALTLSPKSVFRIDRYLEALIELLFYASAVAAGLALGIHWIALLCYGVLAMVTGYTVMMCRKA